MIEDKKSPATVSEAVNRLLSNFSLETKRQVQNTSEDGLINFHFGLGAGIRNEFGLWEKDSKLLEDCKKIAENPILHVDDAAGIIIKALWDRLQEYPLPKIVRD